MKKNILLFVLFLILISCSSGKKDIDTTPLGRNENLATGIKKNYANIVLASYQDALIQAKELQTTVDEFVENPTEDKFATLKTLWLKSREPYGQTEAYRFAEGPIDDEKGPEAFINAWPLDESYIDQVTHSEESNENIIGNVAKYPNITKDLLKQLNEEGGKNERSVSTGYHAIEFLLWGQDTQIPTDGSPNTTGGKRPYTDFVDKGGTLENQERRRIYLKVSTDLLVEHLQYLVDAWKEGTDNYRKKFLAFSNKKAVGKIILGVATLLGPELSGERVYAALQNSSQEDEHSCFSDNTHRDLRLNLKGAINVLKGTYTRIDNSKIEGNSIIELLKKIDEKVATTLENKISETTENVEATHIPFDYGITSHKLAIDKAAVSIAELSKQLGTVASIIGVDATITEESDFFEN